MYSHLWILTLEIDCPKFAFFDVIRESSVNDQKGLKMNNGVLKNGSLEQQCFEYETLRVVNYSFSRCLRCNYLKHRALKCPDLKRLD